jgi:hypothetical protein
MGGLDLIHQLEKKEICISGMATSSRYSLSTQPKVERREHGYTMIMGLNQVLQCNNISLAPTGSHINEEVQVVVVKYPTHTSTRQCSMQLVVVCSDKIVSRQVSG